MRQLERGRTRPGEFTKNWLPRGSQPECHWPGLFAGRAGNRDRVPAQLRQTPQADLPPSGTVAAEPGQRSKTVSGDATHFRNVNGDYMTFLNARL